MKTVLHKAETRGNEDHGWLQARHTFSFANYYNPERIHFGVLRVLNDDVIAPGMGFGMHPHDNMEIITIPIQGKLKHRDSMGNGSVITSGEVQHMSAGNGIMHSEYNASASESINLLQIWLLPKLKDINPVYHQIKVSDALEMGELVTVVSPDGSSGSIPINQEAWFTLGKIESEKSVNYRIKKNGNGIYIFVIDGEVSVASHELNKRDGMGISGVSEIEIKTIKSAYFLLMDIPV